MEWSAGSSQRDPELGPGIGNLLVDRQRLELIAPCGVRNRIARILASSAARSYVMMMTPAARSSSSAAVVLSGATPAVSS